MGKNLLFTQLFYKNFESEKKKQFLQLENVLCREDMLSQLQKWPQFTLQNNVLVLKISHSAIMNTEVFMQSASSLSDINQSRNVTTKFSTNSK